MKNIFKRATALLLSLLMVFSVCSTSLIIYATDGSESLEYDIEKLLEQLKKQYKDDTTLSYVSLGDSMTNGYGLEGYNHNSGVEDYGIGAYPNQFELALENQGYTVDHAQLAMSGIRTEDIHWLLELNYNDPDAIALVNEAIANEDSWDQVEAKWNEFFGCGDYWTVAEICNHSRTDAAFNHIAGICSECTDDVKQVEFPSTVPEDDSYTKAEKVAVIAKYFQEKVAAADIVSLSVGNGNIGVFGFGRIMEVIGFDDDTTYLNYDYEDVLRECDETRAKQLATMIDDIKPVLEAKLPEMEKKTALMNVVLYIAVSLAMNYAGTLDAILQLNDNPELEIILIPVMNTFGDDFARVEGELTIGDMLELVIDPLNKFIAALPTYMQVTNHDVYKNAKFYWAEAAKSISCWVDTYTYPIENEIVRDRFVESVVGTESDPGLVWEKLPGNLGLVAITLNDVIAYETNGPEGLQSWGNNVSSAYMSVLVYLEFEEAIIACKDKPVTIESVMGLGNISDELFAPVMEVAATGNVDKISDALINDPTLSGLLALFARCIIGNGIGAHPSQAGHITLAEAVINAYAEDNTAEDEAFEGFDDAPVVKAIVDYLTSKGYLTDDQILDIAFEAYDLFKDGADDGDNIEIVTCAYETLLLSQVTDEIRIEIILNIYAILNDNYTLSNKLTTFVNLAKKLVDEKKVTPLQAFAVVHFVYLAYANDGKIDSNEYRVIANLIYYVIFGVPKAKMARTGFNWNDFTLEQFNDPNNFNGDLAKLLEAVQNDVAASETKTAAQKIEIIQTVYTELKKDETIIQPNSQIEVVGDLFITLTEEKPETGALLKPDQIEAIIESTFSNLVTPKEEELDINKAIANITQTVVEELVGMEPDKFDQVMDAIQETVDKLGDNNGGEGNEGGAGSIVIPEITIPEEVKIANELMYVLEQEGLLDASQRGELVKALSSVLTGGNIDNPMDLVDKIYSIIYKEGFDIETTVKFVVVVTTFAWDKDLIQGAVNPYYAQAMAQVLTAENVELALKSIDSAIAAIDEAIVALGGTPKAAIENDTTALKAALVEELEATKATLEKIKTVLESDALKNNAGEYEIQAAIAVLLTFEEDLNTHGKNIAAIATEAGILAMPYIQDAIAQINHYAGLAAEMAQAAYEWCVENVNGFVAGYYELANEMKDLASKIDPALGEAVYDFMINTPADTLATLYIYGDKAVEELIDRAGAYADDVYAAAAKLAEVIRKYGKRIYNVIVNDYECKKLYEELLGVYDQILALESLIKAPSDIADVANGIYAQLPALKDYALDLAVRFYDAAIAAVKADDYLMGTELCDAIDALVVALATIDDAAGEYADWLGTHAGAMGGILLNKFLANWDAFYGVAAPIICQNVKDIYYAVKEYILNYDYEALIQKIIDAAIKIAPEVDAYLYDFFYNNPEKVIEFFKEYGDEIVDLFEKYGEFALGVIGVALVTFGPALVDYIIENPEAVIAGLNAWADKYGDRVVAILQVYAEALGICDIVREEIANLEAMRDALVAQLKVLNAQLQTAVGEAREAILAEIARVQAELARVQAKIAELQAKLQAVIDAISNLEEVLKKVANEAIDVATAAVTEAIANLNKALKDLLASVSDDVADKLNQLINTGIGLTKELIADLAKLVVDAVIKFAPELDEMLYDFFYNNPDKVIAFFNEYGDKIIELCKKYGDKALAVVALALATYGSELAEYIINNVEDVFAGIVEWADKYGQRIIDILKVYAEALGICDAVREEIADLTEKLNELQAELMKQLDILNNQLKAELAKLYEELKNAAEPYKQIILEKIKEIESKIELVQQYIAELQSMIAMLQAKIAELQNKFQALVASLDNLNRALQALVRDGIEAGAGAVMQALNAVAYSVIDIINVLSENLAGQITDLLEKAKDYLDDAYQSAILKDYIIDNQSKYVAFGDNNAAADAFAKYLTALVAAEGVGYIYDSDITNAKDGAKITDLIATIMTNPAVVADADLISIGYSYDQIAENTIYILLDLLLNGTTEINYNVNWDTLLGSDIAAEITKVLAQIEAELIANGLNVTLEQFSPDAAAFLEANSNITISEAAMAALGYFAYNAVEYAVLAPQAISMINQINPNALIMLNAISNPLSGASVSIPTVLEFSFGDYLDYVVDIIYVESLALAAINDNVVFVPTTDIETSFTNVAIDATFLAFWYVGAKIEITTSETGVNYIVDKMASALNITVEDGALLGDVNGDGYVTIDDVVCYRRYLAELITANEINLSVADVTGEGKCDINDVVQMRRYLAELITAFPAEEKN